MADIDDQEPTTPYVWKLTPVHVPHEIVQSVTTTDHRYGRRAGIQDGPMLVRADGNASDQCPLCTLMGVHSHGVEELRALEKMVEFLKQKLGVRNG